MAVKVKLEKLRAMEVKDYMDEAEVETLMSRFHPLGEKKLIGNRISYMILYRGDVAAVLQFDKAVDRNKLREERIGWDKSLVKDRTKYIANNCRFLVMPDYAGVKNLASKCLSLVSDRISQDFKRKYGVPLLALETYVDPLHNDNEGSCYKAAGWEHLGMSTGFQKKGSDERTNSKHYYLKPLHEDSYPALKAVSPHALLTGVKNVSKESNNNFVLNTIKIDIKDLQEAISVIKDPRGAQGTVYKFKAFLSICLCAALGGYGQYRQIADWIKRRTPEERVKFGLPGDRIPSESAVNKFLRKIGETNLQEVLNEWVLKNYGRNNFKIVAIDGKSLRATGKEYKNQKGFLNVFLTELGIVIDQIPARKGGEEKTAAREVLKRNKHLDNKIIIADAMQTDELFFEAVRKKTLRRSSPSKVIIQC
ncbi:MAG: ISAs1 family transposase [Candidatus Riflebacteria bacterium]|nr:ISAs1 family transposase [Candidatus Riflebacteria bacterium]